MARRDEGADWAYSTGEQRGCPRRPRPELSEYLSTGDAERHIFMVIRYVILSHDECVN